MSVRHPTNHQEWTAHLQLMRKSRTRDVFLAKCAHRMRIDVKAAAEVGVFEGAFSLLMRQQWPSAHLYLVDPWKHIPDLTKLVGSMHRRGGTPEKNQIVWDRHYANVCAMFANDPKTTIIRKTSADAAPDIPDGSLDLVHIDGDHRYEPVCQDIKLWLPKVRSGGLVTGHDYKFTRSQWKGNRAYLYAVFAAVNDTLGQENIISGRQMTWVYVKP